MNEKQANPYDLPHHFRGENCTRLYVQKVHSAVVSNFKKNVETGGLYLGLCPVVYIDRKSKLSHSSK